MGIIFKDVIKSIDRGKIGLNTGLYHGLDRLREFIPDIQQSTYYLVGGEPSTGKTAFADDFFMYKPFEFLMEDVDSKIKVNWIYFSLEISKLRKITKGICRKLFTDYGLSLDINYVLSKGKNRISDDIYERVIKTADYFDKLEDRLQVVDTPINPDGIYAYLHKYAEANGQFIKVGEHNTVYVPKDENLYTIIIVDHIGLIKALQGLNKKQSIDRLSEYMIYYRNKCNFSSVLISQFNRALSSTDRFKLEMVEPQISDFKETGNPVEDADITFGLFNPSRYRLEQFRGYNIDKLKQYFRSLSILKNRDGEADKVLGMKFEGAVGHFSEYPKAEDMVYEDTQKGLYDE
jgi:replicative DNA helicase